MIPEKYKNLLGIYALVLNAAIFSLINMRAAIGARPFSKFKYFIRQLKSINVVKLPLTHTKRSGTRQSLITLSNFSGKINTDRRLRTQIQWYRVAFYVYTDTRTYIKQRVRRRVPIYTRPILETPTLIFFVFRALFQLYLSHYGYLSPRVKNPHNGQLMSQETMSKAVEEFQAFAGINVTGEILSSRPQMRQSFQEESVFNPGAYF